MEEALIHGELFAADSECMTFSTSCQNVVTLGGLNTALCRNHSGRLCWHLVREYGAARTRCCAKHDRRRSPPPNRLPSSARRALSGCGGDVISGAPPEA